MFCFLLASSVQLFDADGNDSHNGLGGYHGSHDCTDAHGNVTTVYYAVGVYSDVQNNVTNGIVAFDAPWKNVVATFYHEINEFRTDPDVERANDLHNTRLLGWYSDSYGEIGDIPILEAGTNLGKVFLEVELTDGSGTVPIQLMYSNRDHGPSDYSPPVPLRGDMVEFYKLPNPAPWRVFDHTLDVGGATIGGPPAIYSEGPGTALHVFAAGGNGHMLEFYKDAGPWKVFDHTPEVGGDTIAAAGLAIYSEGPGTALHVFAAGGNANLLEFYKDAGPWKVFDHTADTGATIGGPPAIYSEGPGTALHVFAAGGNGHMLEFYKDAGPWKVFDHTPEVGGDTIAAAGLAIYSEGPGTALHVFAAGGNANLLEFYKDAGPWKVFDHTADTGATIGGPPAIYSGGPRHRVARLRGRGQWAHAGVLQGRWPLEGVRPHTGGRRRHDSRRGACDLLGGPRHRVARLRGRGQCQPAGVLQGRWPLEGVRPHRRHWRDDRRPPGDLLGGPRHRVARLR